MKDDFKPVSLRPDHFSRKADRYPYERMSESLTREQKLRALAGYAALGWCGVWFAMWIAGWLA